MGWLNRLFVFFLLFLFQADIALGNKLPVPRFVSLRSNEVNFRVGPGAEYPAKWVYLRYQLPVKVVKERDVWRYVEDHEGIKGWVHQTMLSGLRTLMITGDNLVVLRDKPDTLAPARAKAESGVIGHMVKAERNWCQIKINRDYFWVPRTHIWGLLDIE